MEDARRLRERIEAALTRHLYSRPGVIGEFQDKGVRYRKRFDNEKEIKVYFEAKSKILGLPELMIKE